MASYADTALAVDRQMHMPLTGPPPNLDSMFLKLGELFHGFVYSSLMDQGLLGNNDLFYQLTPDFVLNAVDRCGFMTTGEYLQLNSYENRVYSLRVESTDFDQVVAKFYRPNRWSEEAIREEHDFLRELQGQGVSVIAPLLQKNGQSLSRHEGLWCAIFPKAQARMPQEFSLIELTQLGRVLARLHNVAAQKVAVHRPVIDARNMGWPAIEVIQPLLPQELSDRYLKAAHEILHRLESDLDPRSFQRIHGDCHRGNVLQTDRAGKAREYFLIDFDDFGMGPVVQDIWMLFRHDEDDVDQEIDALLAGYTELRDFDESQLSLMQGLRGLRILHYAAWIARRWSDPSFPQIFPQFGTEAYWFEEVKALESTLD